MNKVVDLYEVKQAEEMAPKTALIPFTDNLPYDRERIIQEAKFCLEVEVKARFEVGKRLLLLRENEDVRTFGQLLEEHLPGLSRQRAYEYILFAKRAAHLPQFRTWASGRNNWSKALALMETVSEEELREFEEGSVLGTPVDEIDRMSVRELKARLRKQQEQHQKEMARALEPLRQEIESFKEEVKLLKAEKEKTDLDAAIERMKAADKKILEGMKLLASIPRELIAQEPVLRDRLLGVTGMVLRVVENFEVMVLEAGAGVER